MRSLRGTAMNNFGGNERNKIIIFCCVGRGSGLVSSFLRLYVLRQQAQKKNAIRDLLEWRSLPCLGYALLRSPRRSDIGLALSSIAVFGSFVNGFRRFSPKKATRNVKGGGPARRSFYP